MCGGQGGLYFTSLGTDFWRGGAVEADTRRPVAMLRSLFVVAAACCAHTATAFAPAAPMALGAQPRAGVHGIARKPFRPAVLPALRMADQSDQVIDFGKVGFSEAENQVCARPHPRRRLRASAARSPSPECSHMRPRACTCRGNPPPSWQSRLWFPASSRVAAGCSGQVSARHAPKVVWG